MNAGPSAEELLIRAFIVPRKRARWLELLRTPKGRKKLCAVLAHCENDLDARYALKIPSGRDSTEAILAALGKYGAGSTCRIVSENVELDGLEMDLPNALASVVNSGMGTFLSIHHGLLAYYEGEDAESKYICVRDSG